MIASAGSRPGFCGLLKNKVKNQVTSLLTSTEALLEQIKIDPTWQWANNDDNGGQWRKPEPDRDTRVAQVSTSIDTHT